LSSDTLKPNPVDTAARLAADSEARPGVLHSSLMSVSPGDLTSVALATAVTDGVRAAADEGSGGDGCDVMPGVALPDDANLALSCCLLFTVYTIYF